MQKTSVKFTPFIFFHSASDSQCMCITSKFQNGFVKFVETLPLGGDISLATLKEASLHPWLLATFLIFFGRSLSFTFFVALKSSPLESHGDAQCCRLDL